MILPWLRGIVGRHLAPLTWTLLILNVYIFAITYEGNAERDRDFFSEQKKFELTANLYYQYKGGQNLPKKSEIFSYGAAAFHDFEFVNNAENMFFRGDQIAIKKWQEELVKFRESLAGRPAKIFGLSWESSRPLTWITYQFMHAGFVHILSNMLMLLIFAGALELQIGGFAVVLIYILSGVAGAVGFLLLGEPTLAPMVGASASLSGIMAFYAIYEKRRRVAFFYFLSPIKGYYGWIWLPTWLIFPLYFVADFAAYFGTLKELGSGVAYTAHIGGMIFGLAAGYLWKRFEQEFMAPPPRSDLLIHHLFSD